MDSRTVALVAVFAALTVALTNSPIRIPAPYAPFLFYQIWEIPIVAAFLLFGPKIGTFIAAINTIVLMLVFQGALPVGPLYNFAAILSMFLGILFAVKFLSRFKVHSETVIITAAVALGMLLRVGVMTVVNWAVLRYPPPVGFSLSDAEVIASLPVIGLFNATVVLYTVPIGQIIAKAVSVATKTAQWGQTKQSGQ